MLVEAMTYKEITAQVMSEYDKILSTTMLRLGLEYEKERKKLKIDKKRTYRKEYVIKTAGKNTWIIILGKAPSQEKFTDRYCTNTCCATYYYNSKGLQVFNPQSTKVILAVYNGHFFMRYNERLRLNLKTPIDIVKHFFKYNSYIEPQITVKGDRLFALGICKSGMLLGEAINDYTWVQWRTFVSKDLLKPGQDELEIELITNLQAQIASEIEKEGHDKLHVQNLLNKLYVITGKSNLD